MNRSKFPSIENSYAKRKISERDLLATKEIERRIKDEIKEKLVQATKQREVCFILSLNTDLFIEQ